MAIAIATRIRNYLLFSKDLRIFRNKIFDILKYFEKKESLILMSSNERSNNKKIILLVSAAAVGIGLWYWWTYVKNKPEPVPTPVPTPQPVIPPAPARTFAIGDRVTHDFVSANPQSDGTCNATVTLMGTICGRNPDDTYNVLWEAVNSRSHADNTARVCPKMNMTMLRSVYSSDAIWEPMRDPVGSFGSCGSRPTREDIGHVLPDHYRSDQLKPLQSSNIVQRSIQVTNQPKLCASATPRTFTLSGTRCADNPKKVSWNSAMSMSTVPTEFEQQYAEGKCQWIKTPENTVEFGELFGDCTKGSALLDSSIIPYENEEKDLFPSSF